MVEDNTHGNREHLLIVKVACVYTMHSACLYAYMKAHDTRTNQAYCAAATVTW